MRLSNHPKHKAFNGRLSRESNQAINHQLLLKLMADEQREFDRWQPLFKRLVVMVVLTVPASFLVTIPFGPITGLLSLAALLPATLFNLMHSLKSKVLARCDKDEAFCRQAVESGLLTNKSANAAANYSRASLPRLIRA